MSQKEKLTQRFLTKPKDFTWDELIRLLNVFGYQLIKKGKTSGSRRRFMHEDYGFIILHEPHPAKVLKQYQIDQVIEQPQQEDLL